MLFSICFNWDRSSSILNMLKCNGILASPYHLLLQVLYSFDFYMNDDEFLLNSELLCAHLWHIQHHSGQHY